MIVVQFGLVLCCGAYNPVLATYRLDQTEKDRTARTLSAWSISSSTTIAVFTALWGVLASLTSSRMAIAIACVCHPGDSALATPPASAPRPLD